jgi:hypothetical protein
MEQSVCQVYECGDRAWRLADGRYHREDGPAAEYANGDKYWYLYGKPHREDGPAMELADGHKEWLVHNMLHREDGPAIILPDGNKEWYLHGKKINCSTQEQFERLMRLRAFW